MLKTKHLLTCAVGIATLCGCASQYNIDGNSSIAGIDGQKMYLRMLNPDGSTQTVSLDSCEVVHGTFYFGGAVDSVAMVEVYMGNNPMMPVVLENGSMFIQMDNAAQSVSGGPLNERLNQFLVKHGRYENELWDLNRRARNMLLYEGKTIDQIIASIDPIKNTLVEQMKALEVQFIKDNYDNVLGPGYFVRMCSNAIGMPAVNDEIMDILVHAPEQFLQHPGVKNYLFMAGVTPSAIRERRAALNIQAPDSLRSRAVEKRTKAKAKR